jgi:cytochrome c biogenesis factor
MRDNLLFCRWFLLVCAILLVAVAIIVALGVIPPVQTDTFLGATPERAVPAFRVIIGLNLLASLTLVIIAIRSTGRSWISISVLIILGLVALLFGIALTDAAFAYQSEGPSMQTVSMLLFFCAAADFLTGALVIITAFLRPKKT